MKRVPPGLLAGGAVLGLAANAYLALAVAPEAANFAAPLTQRVLYFHVPAALAAYVAFTVAAVASARFLWQGRDLRHDRQAHAAAEVGAVLTTIALFTGIVWSRVEFFSAGSLASQGFAFALLGDPKFVATAALWLVFLGYLALRRSVAEADARARLGAVYALLGFLAVPLSYLSSRYSPHPNFLDAGSGISPAMSQILILSVAAWLLVFAALFAARWSVAEDHAAAAGSDADADLGVFGAAGGFA